VLLFGGDDWAQDHHDVEVMDASGRRLVKARLPEGVAGMTRLHAMIGQCLNEKADDVAATVKIGIETDRGPWVQALIAAGYTGLRGQPVAGGPLSGALGGFQGQERRRGRAYAGGYGAH
jgi:hypothetical protein